MTDQTQVYPEITPRDLQDATLHRLNQSIQFLYSQLALTQGITGAFQFTDPQAKSTAIPSSDNGLLTLGAAKKLFVTSSEPGVPGPPGPPGPSGAAGKIQYGG